MSVPPEATTASIAALTASTFEETTSDVSGILVRALLLNETTPTRSRSLISASRSTTCLAAVLRRPAGSFDVMLPDSSSTKAKSTASASGRPGSSTGMQRAGVLDQ